MGIDIKAVITSLIFSQIKAGSNHLLRASFSLVYTFTLSTQRVIIILITSVLCCIAEYRLIDAPYMQQYTLLLFPYYGFH